MEWTQCKCGASYAIYQTVDGVRHIDGGEGDDIDFCDCGEKLPAVNPMPSSYILTPAE